MDKNIVIYLAGDSTTANYTERDRIEGTAYYPLNGWGFALDRFFNSNVAISNQAYGGRSSKSFIDEGRLDNILSTISEGDYLFIQFGHNDSYPDAYYYTDPNTTYKAYLTQYITGARAHNAIPILVTPVNRCRFGSDGSLVNTIGDYPQAMIDLGAELNVPVIDLFGKSKELFEALGLEDTKKLFMFLDPGQYPNYPDGCSDDTHFIENGACKIAELVVQGIREAGDPALISYLLPYASNI